MVADTSGPAWPTDSPSLQRGTAVVIEDHLILRTTLASLLEGLGYAVRAASNGFSGLRLVRQLEPDLVVLDLIMPEIQGQDVLAAMRQDPLTADIPALVITGHPEGLAEVGSLDRVLPKPFAYEELITAVDALAPAPAKALAGMGA